MRNFVIAAIAGSLLTLTGLASTSEAGHRWHRRPTYRYHYGVRPYARNHYSYRPYYNSFGYRPYSSYRYNSGFGYNRSYGYGNVYGPGFSIWW